MPHTEWHGKRICRARAKRAHPRRGRRPRLHASDSRPGTSDPRDSRRSGRACLRADRNGQDRRLCPARAAAHRAPVSCGSREGCGPRERWGRRGRERGERRRGGRGSRQSRRAGRSQRGGSVPLGCGRRGRQHPHGSDAFEAKAEASAPQEGGVCRDCTPGCRHVRQPRRERPDQAQAQAPSWEGDCRQQERQGL